MLQRRAAAALQPPAPSRALRRAAPASTPKQPRRTRAPHATEQRVEPPARSAWAVAPAPLRLACAGFACALLLNARSATAAAAEAAGLVSRRCAPRRLRAAAFCSRAARAALRVTRPSACSRRSWRRGARAAAVRRCRCRVLSPLALRLRAASVACPRTSRLPWWSDCCAAQSPPTQAAAVAPSCRLQPRRGREPKPSQAPLSCPRREAARLFCRPRLHPGAPPSLAPSRRPSWTRRMAGAMLRS